MSGFILSTFPIEFTLRVKTINSEHTRGVIGLGETWLSTHWGMAKVNFSYLCSHGEIVILHQRPEQTATTLYILVSGMLL